MTTEMVSVDVGYGFVKAIASNGQRVTFPSVVGTGQNRSLANFMSQTQNSHEQNLEELHVKVNGKDYYVGEMALRNSADGSRIFEKERYEHDYTMILISVAIQLVVSPQTDKVVLFSGLPLTYFNDQKDSFKEKLEHELPAIEWENGNTFAGHRDVSVQQAMVFPQGLSAIWATLMNHDGKSFNSNLMETGNQIAVIDVGFRTTDICVIEMKDGGAFTTLYPLSDTIDQGVVDLYESLRVAYQNKTGGSDIPDEKIQRILKRGKITFQSKQIDLTQEIEDSYQSVTHSIVDRIKKRWKEESDTFDQIFVVGGGGTQFKDYLQTSFVNNLNHIVDSQYANAIGYYRIGKMFTDDVTNQKIAR